MMTPNEFLLSKGMEPNKDLESLLEEYANICLKNELVENDKSSWFDASTFSPMTEE